MSGTSKPLSLLKGLPGRILAGTIGLLVLGYGLICGYMYVNQDALLYMTNRSPEAAVPDDLHLKQRTLVSPDGAAFRIWFSAPEAGKPIMLFLHGQGASLIDGRYRYRRMQAKGVGYLALDYRGFGGMQGKPSEAGLYADALTAYDFLIAQGYKPDQIVIHGHSLGSGVATWLATQRAAKLLILEAPFTAAVDVGAERYPFLPVNFLMRDKFFSRERMKAIHMPVLIVHGDRDSVVPFVHGQRLYALTNPPKRFVRMKGSDHSTLTKEGVYETVYWPALGL
jgi:uncharacterized protein